MNLQINNMKDESKKRIIFLLTTSVRRLTSHFNPETRIDPDISSWLNTLSYIHVLLNFKC
jgi:hypothetical protein